jgi:hypothetical protein
MTGAPEGGAPVICGGRRFTLLFTLLVASNGVGDPRDLEPVSVDAAVPTTLGVILGDAR